ncbi:hypothetical protein CHUAL_000316 [Chamberlinius hualienensis]
MDLKLLFQTVEEDKKPIDGRVSGKIPDWLKGTFLRVGPGVYELGPHKMNDWMDGYSVINAFHLHGDNKATYQRRHLQSDSFTKGLKAKKPVATEFGSYSHPDPQKGFISRMVNSIVPGDMTDNCNLNIYPCQGGFVVATETCFTRVIDPHTLETKDKIDLNKLASINTTTCHPHIANDGSLLNVGCNFLSGLKYTIYKTPSGSGQGAKVMDGTSVVNTISPSWKASYGYFHSFGVTDNYIVFVEQPQLVSSVKLATSQINKRAFKDCMDWTPDEKVKFFIIEKATGQKLKTTYHAAPFFTLHHINCYEEDDHVIVDLIAFQTSEVLSLFNLEKLASGTVEAKDIPTPKRWVLPLPKKLDGATSGNLVTLKNTKATAETLKDGVVFCTPECIFDFGGVGGFDLPRINYKRNNGKPYRYVYGTGFIETGLTKNSLCKGDITTRKVELWNAGNDFYCGEPAFIPSPNAQDEDDGVVVAGVCSGKADKEDYMIVLDGKSFKEIARISVPVRVPIGTHGIFISA